MPKMGLNFFASQKIQFRDKDDPQPLIERSCRKKTQLVRTPVHAVHRLVGDLQDWDIIAYFGNIIARRQGHLKFSQKKWRNQFNSTKPNCVFCYLLWQNWAIFSSTNDEGQIHICFVENVLISLIDREASHQWQWGIATKIWPSPQYNVHIIAHHSSHKSELTWCCWRSLRLPGTPWPSLLLWTTMLK